MERSRFLIQIEASVINDASLSEAAWACNENPGINVGFVFSSIASATDYCRIWGNVIRQMPGVERIASRPSGHPYMVKFNNGSRIIFFSEHQDYSHKYSGLFFNRVYTQNKWTSLSCFRSAPYDYLGNVDVDSVRDQFIMGF